MALEKEMETYQRVFAELQAHQGKYALIHDSEVVDIFGTYEDALKEGYDQFGLEPFLVKQIRAIEQVQYFTRDLVTSCHT
jgi:hypothetical protein